MYCWERKAMLRNKHQVAFFVISICLLLSACNDERDENSPLSIMLFADLPLEYSEKLDEFIEKDIAYQAESEVNFLVHPAMPEKLLVEIVAGDGDIFLVDESLVNTIFDPIGLVPLDELIS